MIDNSTIDNVINELDQIRQRLIVKYGAGFGNLPVNAQVEVVKLVYKAITGASV